MDEVGVAVCTFGSDDWEMLGREKHDAVLRNQTVCPDYSVRIHGESLSSARNEALESLPTEWVIFLDADDELDVGYVEAMRDAVGLRAADIWQPSTLGIYPDGHEDAEPVVLPKRNIFRGNYLVIGSMMRRRKALKAGGFRELPVLEDWDLWIRMHLGGSMVGICPKAIYRVMVREGSRNSDQGLHNKVYKEIVKEYRGRRSNPTS